MKFITMFVRFLPLAKHKGKKFFGTESPQSENNGDHAGGINPTVESMIPRHRRRVNGTSTAAAASR